MPFATRDSHCDWDPSCALFRTNVRALPIPDLVARDIASKRLCDLKSIARHRESGHCNVFLDVPLGCHGADVSVGD